MTNELLSISMEDGELIYKNPQLDEELCGFYSNLKNSEKRQWDEGDASTGNYKCKRKSCKGCAGRGFQQMDNGRGMQFSKACGCIVKHLQATEDVGVTQETKSPMGDR